MALRNRSNLPVSKIGQENVAVIKQKAVVSLPIVQRAALGEIGNKVVPHNSSILPFQEVKKNTRPGLVTKKPEVLQSKASETFQRSVLDRAVTTKPVPNVLLKQDSISSNALNVDIDKENGNDQLMLGMYASDIYLHLRELEAKYPVEPNYLKGLSLHGNMRAILVDWLVDVHVQFRLLNETLYLTVATVDRFIQKARNIHRRKYQLVGVAAMLIASKYEETFSPEISDFVYIADNSFSKTEILNMEYTILKALDFNLGRPLPPHFLRRYSKAVNAEPLVHTMAKYFMELSLVEYNLCHIPPSLIAAAAIYLTLWLLGSKERSVWSNTMIHYSKYTYKNIAPVVKTMATTVIDAESSKYSAVYKKYSQAKFLKVSTHKELKCVLLKKLATT